MGRFNDIIGVGGIGTGTLWHMADNRILGKNESRSAVLSDARDYCKQHIILHYLAKVLAGETKIHAIGKVGNDVSGHRLLTEMHEAGIDTACVKTDDSGVTMQSVCIHYPDKSVCNVTTSNSVCQNVDAEYVRQCLHGLESIPDEGTLMMAAPEVPLEARLALLRAGRERGAFNVASVLCEEADKFLRSGGLMLCDLMVINEEEAQALAKVPGPDTKRLAAAIQRLISQNNETLSIIITLGKNGSIAVDSRNLLQKDAPPAEAVSTAGAGDAYTAGVICGLNFGCDLFGEDSVLSAIDIGNFFAGRSIRCKHTIDDSISRKAVLDFMSGRQ